VPVNRDEFRAGEWNLGRAIDSFLRENRALAFSVEELLFELDEMGIPSDREAVEDALSNLIRRGYVEAKTLRGTLYYAYDDTLGFRPPR
jgi:hypothetical protein